MTWHDSGSDLNARHRHIPAYIVTQADGPGQGHTVHTDKTGQREKP